MCPRKAAPPRPRIWGWIGLLRLPFPARNAATEMWARRRRMRAVDKPLAAAEPLCNHGRKDQRGAIRAAQLRVSLDEIRGRQSPEAGGMTRAVGNAAAAVALGLSEVGGR